MPNIIIPKKSSVSGKVPTASQLATGELALNLKDGTLYFKDDVGVVKTLAMARLLDSGVTAGTYGSTTVVPQITVDAKGRVTAVTNQSIAFPVMSVFGRTGAVTLGSSDVTTALGFSPANASGANASGTWNNAADRLFLADTRGVNEAPADFSSGVHFDFKSNTTNGLADGGTYNGVLTLRKWGTGIDNSGGSVNQLGFTENGNLWLRSGTPGGSWAAWKRIINESNLLSTLLTVDGAGSGLDADLLDGQDSAYYRNASNLNAGVVPNAQISGLYDGVTLKLNGGNTVISTTNPGSTATNAIAVSHLASYRSGASSQVGAIVFMAPAGLNLGMLQFKVRGLLYNQHIVDFIIQGHWNGSGWFDLRKINYGSVDIQVRWGRLTSTGQLCLILGDIGTTWSYPHFDITEALISHMSSIVDNHFTNWMVGVYADLSTFTMTSYVSSVSQIGSISGNAATATKLATARSLSFTGAVTGSGSFDGSGNLNITLSTGDVDYGTL